jgi:hypothetical protein
MLLVIKPISERNTAFMTKIWLYKMAGIVWIHIINFNATYVVEDSNDILNNLLFYASVCAIGHENLLQNDTNEYLTFYR